MSAEDRQPLHFIAIGGAGMSGLALVCHRLGHRVTGSDRAESAYLERLRVAGIEPVVGHDADAVPADAEVVVSTAIPEDNVELVRARERGQAVIHRSDLLARVCGDKRLIAVAGAHGKTTTAGMIAHALATAGADPAYLLGGELLTTRWRFLGADRAMVGFAAFDNSFGQFSKYLWFGQEWDWTRFAGGDVFVNVTGGLLKGYRGEYRDKIPFNSSGIAPVILPSLGVRWGRFSLQATVLGTNGFLIGGSRVFDLWPGERMAVPVPR